MAIIVQVPAAITQAIYNERIGRASQTLGF